MIKVEELRIDNFLYDAAGNIGMVLLGVGKYVLATRERGIISLEECAPIPLTPELLEKCGFEKFRLPMTIAYQLIHEGWEFYFVGYLFIHRTEHEDYFETNVEYIHQLQNLYFALTNEELNVQL